MKNFLILIIVAVSLLATLAFSYDHEPSLQEHMRATTPIEGTWKLVKTKWGDMEEHKVPEREIYKIFTKEHFFFLYIDGNQVSGAGGGTYTADDNSFTESLQYYSWDHSAAGTQQKFDYTIEGNQLHQTGMIKNTDKYDNYVIDEYYERVEDGISATKGNGLMGVWEYADGNGSTSDYLRENNLRSIKAITPQHFYFVFTEKATGKYHGVGFGKYELHNNKYTEHIAAFSFDSTAVGQTYDFTLEIDRDQITQIGELNTEQYQNFTVKERFKRVE